MVVVADVPVVALVAVPTVAAGDGFDAFAVGAFAVAVVELVAFAIEPVEDAFGAPAFGAPAFGAPAFGALGLDVVGAIAAGVDAFDAVVDAFAADVDGLDAFAAGFDAAVDALDARPGLFAVVDEVAWAGIAFGAAGVAFGAFGGALGGPDGPLDAEAGSFVSGAASAVVDRRVRGRAFDVIASVSP